MSKTVISVENLTKRYDLGVIGTGTLSRDLNRWWARLRGQPDPYTRIGQKDHFERIGESILALDDVSFKVEQGEALGIIGKNGAGKSTLLKILSRVTAPTSGVVKVRGRIGSLLEVGTGFHPELTGRENVYLNGAILGMRKDEVDRKFDEIVDFSGVEKFIDTPVKRYSSGMYVRLAFAVAAHLDPEILVVDEVLAVGDAEFQKKCLGKMGDVASEGRTVLFVSHNMGAIRELCNKGILLSSGEISYAGDSNNCVNQYLNIKQKKLQLIKDHKVYESSLVNVDEIKFNGQEFDQIFLKSNENELNFEVSGFCFQPIYMDLEIRIVDIYGSILALYSPGHMRGYAKLIQQGKFNLRWKINLPKNMTRGDYILDIMLTDPNKTIWSKIPGAIRITYEGYPTKSGRLIEYKSGAGWLLLGDEDD